MKVPASFRVIYNEQCDLALVLQRRVDDLLRNKKDAAWHYVSRIKSLESFALKLESGRVSDPRTLEDFFACTLVVRNSTEIARAEQLVYEAFALKERRPMSDTSTHKRPDSFPFDDLRLYVSWQDAPQSPPTPVNGMVFEVQVKTFLQHAWSIATHDLAYKTAEPHWGKQRIAFQIKAMLEHAEVSIQEAEQLARGAELSKTTRDSRRIADAIAMLRRVWTSRDDLPDDLRRLSENICALCDAVRLEVADLETLLNEETAAGRGAQVRNLSPFGVIVESLFRRHRDKIVAALADRKYNRTSRIAIPAELELPEDIDPSRWPVSVRPTSSGASASTRDDLGQEVSHVRSRIPRRPSWCIVLP